MTEKTTKTVVGILEKAAVFGERTLSNGTRLLGHVPHVAPQAWFHIIFSPLSVGEIATLERTLGRRVPPVYKDFLMTFGDGLGVFSGSISLDGLQRSTTRSGDDLCVPFPLDIPNVYERLRNADPNAFFIGGYGQDVSLLYLNGERVFRCSRKSATPLNTWDSFEEMLVGELNRLSKLFDGSGRLKQAGAITTP